MQSFGTERSVDKFNTISEANYTGHFHFHQNIYTASGRQNVPQWRCIYKYTFKYIHANVHLRIWKWHFRLLSLHDGMRVLAYFNEKLYGKYICSVCYKQSLAFGTKILILRGQRAKAENWFAFHGKIYGHGQQTTVNEGINFLITT